MAYAQLARYYDLENAEFTEDLEFWLELADDHGDPVLELGCGTGRVLLHLARRGHAVTGVDNSPEMLARLREKLKPAARHLPKPPVVIEDNLAHFRTEALCQIALMPFNTFMHLLTPEAQTATLRNIRRHVVEGAPLVLDLVNPVEAYASAEQGLTLERTFAHLEGQTERTVQQFSQYQVDRATQLARVTWLYDSVGPEGDVRRTIVPLTLRYTFPGEMRLLLEKGGFALTHLWGDYDHSPFSESAPRMIVMAEAV